MNKKIKIIDLINMLYKREEMPLHIRQLDAFKFSGDYYKYDKSINWYINEETAELLDVYKKLNEEVEILEDNTEEIEELKNRSDEYFSMLSEETKIKWLNKYQQENKDKINELVKAINQMRKDLNK